MTACKVLAVQAGEENKAKALRAKKRCNKSPQMPSRPKTKKVQDEEPKQQEKAKSPRAPPKKVLGPKDQRQAILEWQSLLGTPKHASLAWSFLEAII